MIKNIEKFIMLNLKKINKKNFRILKNKNLFDQNFDSLDFLKLIFIIENHYNIKIKSKDFPNINKINNLIKYVKKNEKRLHKKRY